MSPREVMSRRVVQPVKYVECAGHRRVGAVQGPPTVLTAGRPRAMPAPLSPWDGRRAVHRNTLNRITHIARRETIGPGPRTASPALARVDRAGIERTTGLVLPADYREFVETYGGGEIDECLSVSTPPVAGVVFEILLDGVEPALVDFEELGAAAPRWEGSTPCTAWRPAAPHLPAADHRRLQTEESADGVSARE